MTVLNVAYPLAPVRPDTAGGAEQVLAMLDRALTAAGHESLVIACRGSEVRGTLIETECPTGTWSDFVVQNVRSAYRDTIMRVVDRHRPDLVHLHGIDFADYLPREGVPAIATLHLPPSWYPPSVFALTRPKTYIHCVSSAQRSDCPEAPNILPTLKNGVSDRFRTDVRRRSFALTLARICPEKEIDTALRASRQAKVPLLIAGQVFPYESHVRYFEEQVKPLLSAAARFLGPVGKRAKRRLLAAARCVLIPSNVSETSSLVAMEAAMSGTPVVAFDMGALTEIVQDGKTGFLVDNEQEMADAIAECSTIDPATCRKVALERFSENRAQAEYLRMYEDLLHR